MSEKRQIPRWQLGKEGSLKLEGHGFEGNCRIEDMNLKGLQISLNERLPMDSLLDVKMEMDDGLNFKAKVCVRWDKMQEDRFHYGMEFQNIQGNCIDKIDQFLNDNCFDQFQKKWWSKEV